MAAQIVALKSEIATLCLAMDQTKHVLALKTQALSMHKEKVATLEDRIQTLEDNMEATTAGWEKTKGVAKARSGKQQLKIEELQEALLGLQADLARKDKTIDLYSQRLGKRGRAEAPPP